MTRSQTVLLELLHRGGAVPSGDWTLGSGGYVVKRPVPIGCREVSTREIPSLPARSRAAAERAVAHRPRVRRLTVVTDWTMADALTKPQTILNHH